MGSCDGCRGCGGTVTLTLFLAVGASVLAIHFTTISISFLEGHSPRVRRVRAISFHAWAKLLNDTFAAMKNVAIFALAAIAIRISRRHFTAVTRISLNDIVTSFGTRTWTQNMIFF